MSDSSSDSDTENHIDGEVENEKESLPANSEKNDQDSEKSFSDLGLVDTLCQACASLGWKKPSKIQVESIPVALAKHDVIGLAETGSGKTGAFALPLLQALLEKPQRFFGLVLTPTRELAFQIAEQFEALGKTIGVKCAVLVGKLYHANAFRCTNYKEFIMRGKSHFC